MNRKFVDLTGQRFSRLTVIKRHPINKERQATWHCVCDCGNEKVVAGSNLRRGHTKSCGCLSRERPAEVGRLKRKDVTGQVFGRLTVVRDAEDVFVPGEKKLKSKRRRRRVVCLCSCGNEITVRLDYLLAGDAVSCSCWRKEIFLARVTTHGLAARGPRANPLYARYKRYGVKPEQIKVLHWLQRGLCPVCEQPLSIETLSNTSLHNFHVDHDHGCPNHPSYKGCSDCIRGLLHGPCNTALPSIEKSPRLRAALKEYLAKRPLKSFLGWQEFFADIWPDVEKPKPYRSFSESQKQRVRLGMANAVANGKKLGRRPRTRLRKKAA